MLSKILMIMVLCGIAAPLHAQWRLELARDVTLRIKAQSGPLITDIHGDRLPIPLPLGEPVRLEFTSHGSSACTRPGPVTLTPEGTMLTVILLDSLRSGACTLDYSEFPRQLTHTFSEPGRFRLRIVGRVDDQVVELLVTRLLPKERPPDDPSVL